MTVIIIDVWKDWMITSLVTVNKLKTDNWFFRLYYKLSVILVILFSLSYSITTWQVPILCIGNKHNNAAKEVRATVSDFCLASGTFTISNIDPAKEIYPGIGPIPRNPTLIYHMSYRWMHFFITCSVVILLFPRFVWIYIENKRLERLCKNLNAILYVGFTDEDLKTEVVKLVSYLGTHVGYHVQYAYGFVVSEILNVGAAGLMMFLWNLAAGNAFTQNGAGHYSIKSHPQNRTDPLARAFPLLTKCIFKNYGHGGSEQVHDFMCVMPLNAVTEKAAVFFWYYYMTLVILGLVAVVVRISIICSRTLRICLLCGCTSLTSLKDVELVVDSVDYSDWFMIYQLGNALEPMVFRQVLDGFVKQLRGQVFMEEGVGQQQPMARSS